MGRWLRRLLGWLAAGLFVPVGAGFADEAAAAIVVRPATVVLENPEAAQQLLVMQRDADGVRDVTRKARGEVSPPHIATIDERGLIRPLADGQAQLTLVVDDDSVVVPIEVRGQADPPPVSFRHEIVPLLTKARCNAGGCHGKAEGQNGFRLSIFGFDPAADYDALALEGRGRRITPASPAHSLVFRKGSARMPHGGGLKIEPGGAHDRRLLRWIAEGATFTAPGDEQAETVALEVDPAAQVLLAGQTQQLRVTAIDAAGRRRCVTAEADYESNAAPLADVDERGLVAASDIPGEAAILVRFAGRVAVCRVTLPRPQARFARPPEHNFIDRLVWDKLERLGIEPSDVADDAAFLRRASLDTIGTLPTADEARAFLADASPDKRARLIDRLLQRPEYVDYWTMHWLNLLRADQATVSPQGVVAVERWLRRSLQENKPYDQLARELLTVQGDTSAAGPGSFYKSLPKPDEAARALSQLLLGVRIECAQCHHHPSERWGQDDYVALAGFFTGVSLKKLPSGEQAIVSRGGKDLPHPRGGEPVPARALGAAAADFTGVVDRRRVLADWLTAPDNPFFARAIANRLWAHYFGRGLVTPIDDLRDTNPASNEPLLDALADHLRDVDYDLRAFTRTLLSSRAYQLSGAANASNESDEQNFSHALGKPLPAEVLLDAICQATEAPEKFNGWPEGYRAIQVWDNRLPSYFFTIFGRPVRATVCECERSNEPSIAQALHLLNAPEIAGKLSHRQGRVRRLAATPLSPEQIIDELYLATLSRYPTADETALMLTAFTGDDRRAAIEDILWALLNSKQFIFNQ